MTNKFSVLNHVIKNIIALYGENGKAWVEKLPTFISSYEKQWGFEVKSCFSDAQFNIVIDAVQNNGAPVVFKCCFPNKEFTTEALALLHYEAHGAVKLLKSDIKNGAMLLERITPGIILEKNNTIEDATQQAISVCKKLHKPIQNSSQFPILQYWFDGLNRASSDFIDRKLIEKAKQLSHELLSSQTNLVLLHGDLHYANLLSSADGYLAIDPKGIIGEPEFEIPLPRVTNPITEKELLYRLDCFIEHAQFDQKRIYSWVFCKSVLAACWTIEDSGSATEYTTRFLTVANIINNFRFNGH